MSPLLTPVHGAATAWTRKVVANGPYAPERESLRVNGFRTWYQDGKFGIFIQWGPSSTSGFRADWYAPWRKLFTAQCLNLAME